jgi:hypothetical protein
MIQDILIHDFTLRRAITAVLVGLALCGPAAAQQVGTATAVNPLSETTPPGASTVALSVGAQIVHKERIHTTPSGSAQLMFLDKSTLSIAPNTNILIDEYVYDPASGAGHMLTRLTEGTLRFVGGALSHEGQATIVTPAAAIGIRGGTVTVIFGPQGATIIDHYGIITITNGAGTTTLSRPDFKIEVLNWNTPAGPALPVTEAEIAYYLALLTSKGGQNGGVSGFKIVTVGGCGVIGAQGTNCPNIPWLPTDTGESIAFQTILQANQFGTKPTHHIYPR